jgi:hypothetical protein
MIEKIFVVVEKKSCWNRKLPAQLDGRTNVLLLGRERSSRALWERRRLKRKPDFRKFTYAHYPRHGFVVRVAVLVAGL